MGRKTSQHQGTTPEDKRHRALDYAFLETETGDGSSSDAVWWDRLWGAFVQDLQSNVSPKSDFTSVQLTKTTFGQKKKSRWKPRIKLGLNQDKTKEIMTKGLTLAHYLGLSLSEQRATCVDARLTVTTPRSKSFWPNRETIMTLSAALS